MKVLVTAGKTCTMLDQVRKLDNIFSGQTGTSIAHQFVEGGHTVTLLTSSPDLVVKAYDHSMTVRQFVTFADLRHLMEEEIASGGYDVVIHSAAVGDYEATGRQLVVVGSVDSDTPLVQALPPRGKIPSGYERLLVELRPTEKLVDLIREPWGFQGFLVKFKLQVDNERGERMSDAELIAIARRSRAHSHADCIVANCLEWAHWRAIVIGRDEVPLSVTRDGIAATLIEMVS